jgi:hypothetical protein
MRRRERGQALPEFALALPIFLLLVFGIVQVSLVFATDIALVSATRDVARQAVTFRVEGDAARAAACQLVADEYRAGVARAMPGYVAARLVGEVAYEPVDGPDGAPLFTDVTIRSSYAAPLLIPLVGSILDRVDGVGGPAWAPPGETYVLGATETMRLEGSEAEDTVTCAV